MTHPESDPSNLRQDFDQETAAAGASSPALAAEAIVAASSFAAGWEHPFASLFPAGIQDAPSTSPVRLQTHGEEHPEDDNSHREEEADEEEEAAENNNNSKKRRRSRVIMAPGRCSPLSDDFPIDEADFYALMAVLTASGWGKYDIAAEIRHLVRLHPFDEERRVIDFFADIDYYPEGLDEIPEEIGDLSELLKLTLRGSFTSLPTSIGRLGKLTYLCLDDTEELLVLPKEIGDLSNLVELILCGSFTSLPNSIGSLEKLTCLRLCDTDNLLTLPEEIGDLKNLQVLDLGGWETTVPLSSMTTIPASIGKLRHLYELTITYPTITSLPPSIGQLCNLQTLNLSYTGLSALPEEIGGLTSLTLLNLSYSNIASLPRAIERLHDLRGLDLTETTNLSEVPNEIGNLSSLRMLFLCRSGIQRVPSSVGKLRNLKVLHLHGSKINRLSDGVNRIPLGSLVRLMDLTLPRIPVPGREEEDQEQLLISLVENVPFLGSLGLEAETGKPRLAHALACNRARRRLPLKTYEEYYMRKLWPLVLENARKLFRHYVQSEVGYCYRPDRCSCYHPDSCLCRDKMLQSDAIYQLLIDGRGSFIDALLHRKTNAV